MDTSESGTTMLRGALAIVAMSIALSAQVTEAQSDPIGYNALLASFSAAGLPAPGTGIVVEQNEAPFQGVATAYAPNSSQPYLNHGITIINESSSGTTESGHADTVAQVFYGNKASGIPSAYGVSTIDLFNADLWAGSGVNTLNTQTLNPPSALPANNPVVANFSWTSDISNTGSAAYNNDALRRFDYVIDQTNLVAVVGVDNGAGNPILPLMASGYNSIAVGLNNGLSSTGPVPTNGVDGPGRSKPDVVAPDPFSTNAVSYATPSVSSEAAMLEQVARTYSFSAGTNAATIKAIIMAGTDKNPLSSWGHTSTLRRSTRSGARGR